MPTIALVDDDRNILTSVSIALEAEGETNSDINAQRTGALAYLFPDQKFPDGISSPNLRAFVNAVLHCSGAAEVSRTLNEAVQLAERKAMRPFSEFQVWDFPLWSLPYQWSG